MVLVYGIAVKVEWKFYYSVEIEMFFNFTNYNRASDFSNKPLEAAVPSNTLTN